jgi:lipoate-protein ligase A
LKHGSVLLAPQTELWTDLLEAADPISLQAGLARRTTSMGEILGRSVEAAEVVQALARGFEKVLNIHLERGVLTSEEWALAGEIAPKEFPALGTTGTSSD